MPHTSKKLAALAGVLAVAMLVLALSPVMVAASDGPDFSVIQLEVPGEGTPEYITIEETPPPVDENPDGPTLPEEGQGEGGEQTTPSDGGEVIEDPEVAEEGEDPEEADEEDDEDDEDALEAEGFSLIRPSAILVGVGTISSIFPDPVLAQTIAGQLGKGVGDTVTQNELNNVRNINISGSLHNIEGAQYLNGLTEMRVSNNQLTERIPAAFLSDIYPKINWYANNQRYEAPAISISGPTLQGLEEQLPPLVFQVIENSGGRAIGTWSVQNQSTGAYNSFPAVDGSELAGFSPGASGNLMVQLTLSYPAWLDLENSIYIFRVNYDAATNGTITGRVTNQTGSPLAGVSMTLSSGASTTTGANGQYTFANLAPNTYNVTASLAGYINQTKPGTVTAGGTTVVNFTLQPNVGSVIGTVISSANSAPLGGVAVTLYTYPGFATAGTTTTAANGTYAFSAVPTGTYTVRTSFAGYETGISVNSPVGNKQTTVLDVIMTPLSVTITGTVYIAGTTPPAPLADSIITLPNGQTVPTDANGRYTVTVPPGEYRLTASHPNYSSEQETVTAPLGGSAVQDFYLQADPAPITVLVQDAATLAPLPGATLSSGDYTATTGADGTYTRQAAPGDYTVTASLAGYNSNSETFTVVAGTPDTITISLTRQTGPLTGFVYDATAGNTPIDGAIVTLQPGGETATTDSNGFYSFPSVAGGTYTATASYTASYNTDTQTVVVTTAGGQQDFYLNNLNLVPQLRGAVVDIDSRLGIEDATVTVVGQGNVLTLANGTYAYNSLPAGSYTVTVSAPGYQSLTRTGVTLTDGQITVANFPLVPLRGALTGTVTYSNGVPVPNVRIVINNDDSMFTFTDEDGYYSFFLMEDTYTVTELESTHAPQTEVATIQSDETAVVNFVLDILPGTLIGTVTGPGGAPLAGAQITAHTVANGARAVYTATTTGDGNYTIVDMEPGDYSITASHTQYAAETKTGTIAQDEITRVDFQLVNHPGLLEGTVTAQDTGLPLAGAEIIILPDNILLQTDENGYYHILLVDGDYTVTASYAGYSAQTKPAAIVGDGTTTVDFVLARGGSGGGGSGGSGSSGVDAAAVANLLGGSPRTGDNANASLYLWLAGLSVGGLLVAAGVYLYRRRRSQ